MQSGSLGQSPPPPPLPIEFLASGSWRQLGRPTNFSPGHFLTPSPPSAFLSSPSAPFERRHPGPERVLQFNYFQILCSGHPGTPLSAIESAGRPAGAPQPAQALNPLGLGGGGGGGGPRVNARLLRSRPRLPLLEEGTVTEEKGRFAARFGGAHPRTVVTTPLHLRALWLAAGVGPLVGRWLGLGFGGDWTGEGPTCTDPLSPGLQSSVCVLTAGRPFLASLGSLR